MIFLTFFDANSARYIAENNPMGSATSIAINAIITVPNNTGNIPKEP